MDDQTPKIEAVKPNTDGANSTEFTVVKWHTIIAAAGAILGMITAIGADALTIITPVLSGKALVYGGIAVSMSSLVYGYLAQNGYIKSRTEIKVAQQAAVKDALTQSVSAPNAPNATNVIINTANPENVKVERDLSKDLEKRAPLPPDSN